MCLTIACRAYLSGHITRIENMAGGDTGDLCPRLTVEPLQRCTVSIDESDSVEPGLSDDSAPVMRSRFGLGGNSRTSGGDCRDASDEMEDRVDMRLVPLVCIEGSELPDEAVDSCLNGDTALTALESESVLASCGDQCGSIVVGRFGGANGVTADDVRPGVPTAVGG
jgi:hypothetical protein